jgi:uncharacterized protein YjbJ (UPF0337 family)
MMLLDVGDRGSRPPAVRSPGPSVAHVAGGTDEVSDRYVPDTPFDLEVMMDWNRVEGNWKQVKGKVKEKWGKLTDDDLNVINGRRDQLEGKIQERYGVAKDQIRKDINDWYDAQTW